MLNIGDEKTICHEGDRDLLVRVTTHGVALLRREATIVDGRRTTVMHVDPSAGLVLSWAHVRELLDTLDELPAA